MQRELTDGTAFNCPNCSELKVSQVESAASDGESQTDERLQLLEDRVTDALHRVPLVRPN
jgi:hypothetical protein